MLKQVAENLYIHTPPTFITPLTNKSIFLAGSIEQGTAENWQDEAISVFKSKGVWADVFNPRRDNWDSSWEQSIKNAEFNSQVTWELDMLDAADIVGMYFDSNTKSPITLLELGICSSKYPKKTVVYCDPAFWRYGNVEIVCKRSGIYLINNKDLFFETLTYYLQG